MSYDLLPHDRVPDQLDMEVLRETITIRVTHNRNDAYFTTWEPQPMPAGWTPGPNDPKLVLLPHVELAIQRRLVAARLRRRLGDPLIVIGESSTVRWFR